MFRLHKTDTMDTTPFLYYRGADGEAFYAGEAVVLVGGEITKCDTTTKPQFICVCDVAANSSHGAIPVFAVSASMELQTVPDSPIPTTLVGSSVTLNSTATSCTDTTTGGVFTVTYTEGKAGSPVLGRFR